ncbi:dihydrofolate reductase family protein [Microlunatus speluncae]|uniref:dihydrofolate reductase family protein n=1 Tax=Microlunatus speluncae TaxID=2594267 RepID=UPI00126659F6|nr:dihydrofolate reductase family protein [Microlunatus speluncae]
MIIASHFITLDGVFESPEQWHPAFVSDELYAVLLEQLARADGLLLGRRCYDEFAAYWPLQGDEVPVANETNAAHKYVVSSRPDLPWGPAEVLPDGPAGAARELDRRGATGWATGGELTRSLLAAGLVDELQFYLDPIVLGQGRQLWQGEVGQSRFDLVGHRALPHGVLHLTYRASGVGA